MKCHAWCCVPVNEAGHVFTVRQQTLVVTAHVNEPLRWRCKPIDGRHHSSSGRLQLEYLSATRADWREPTCPESQIDHEHLGAASLSVVRKFRKQGTLRMELRLHREVGEPDDRFSSRTHHNSHLTSDGSRSRYHKRRFSEPTLFSEGPETASEVDWHIL